MTLLDEAFAAHGGLDRWSAVRTVTLDLRMGGNLLMSKWKSPRVRPFRVEVDARRVRATLDPFPRSGHAGVFEGDRVSIVSTDGRTIAARDVVRDADGSVRRKLIWDDLDVLYFLGYALWNYTVTPFLFAWPGFECREAGEWKEPVARTEVRSELRSELRTLAVRYPAGFPTHCRDQMFYFDRQGLLRRLDYTAEVFSHRARGVHLCEAHRTFDGFVWPTHRVVYPRRSNGAPLRLFSVMEGWIRSVSVDA